MIKTSILYCISIIIFSVVLHSGAVAQTAAHNIVIETSMGRIKCILYEETPMHSENFVTLSRDGYFNGQLFHRVISGFMIQSGSPDSKNAEKGQPIGSGGPGYTVPGEFHPALYHKKGVLAAARQGDQVNPNRESSGSQFYIVQGKILSDADLDKMESTGNHIKFTPEQRTVYKTLGGTPHLDYAYTVFGEVIEGLDIVDNIASVKTDQNNRPVDDVKILKITVLK
jgi:peptidyl-prolyl cis-trans isomerase B (cyclophilin B)